MKPPPSAWSASWGASSASSAWRAGRNRPISYSKTPPISMYSAMTSAMGISLFPMGSSPASAATTAAKRWMSPAALSAPASSMPTSTWKAAWFPLPSLPERSSATAPPLSSPIRTRSPMSWEWMASAICWRPPRACRWMSTLCCPAACPPRRWMKAAARWIIRPSMTCMTTLEFLA